MVKFCWDLGEQVQIAAGRWMLSWKWDFLMSLNLLCPGQEARVKEFSWAPEKDLMDVGD